MAYDIERESWGFREWIPILISFVAVWFSVEGYFSSQEIRQLTFTPSFEFVVDEMIVPDAANVGVYHHRVYVRNDGPGHGTITKLEVFVGGEPIHVAPFHSSFQIVVDWNSVPEGTIQYVIPMFRELDTIPPGATEELMRFVWRSPMDPFRSNMQGDLEVSLYYEDTLANREFVLKDVLQTKAPKGHIPFSIGSKRPKGT